MAGDKEAGKRGARGHYLGIHFTCCNIYARIHKNKAGTAYVGWCPRCLRKVEVKISRGGDGTDQRIFQAT